MTVAVDAGPLITLSKLQILDLLPELYERVLVARPVFDEVVTRGLQAGHLDAHAVQRAVVRGEIVIVDTSAHEIAEELGTLRLGAGERHTIHLGMREPLEWVLLDDLLAREAAAKLGLRVKGTIGVIVQAARTGRLTPPERDLIFQTLIGRADIWIDESLVRRVWRELQARD